MILRGMANYHEVVNQEAFMVMGQYIFGTEKLDLREKFDIFKVVFKKMLTLVEGEMESQLTFFNNAAALNHIYRFISDYDFYIEKMKLTDNRNVAFFPGTFDPFSLSHKAIVKTIRDMGYDVYLALDEFSWSKLTLPNLLRRNIVEMSVADELNVYLYPEEEQVNIANVDDLKILRKNFPQSEVYMVMGRDVIVNASAYQEPYTEGSIYSFPHILFERKRGGEGAETEDMWEQAIKKIRAKTIKLSLPPQYEDISSTQIRNYINENRDISTLVDPLVEQYVYEHSFYRREPQYKTLIGTISIKVGVERKLTGRLEEEILRLVYRAEPDQLRQRLRKLMEQDGATLITIRDLNRENKLLGFSLFHSIRAHDYFQEFKNSNISEYIRENAVGRVVIIAGIFIDSSTAFENLEQTVLNETLTYCLADEYHYAVYKNEIENNPAVHEILELHGFQKSS